MTPVFRRSRVRVLATTGGAVIACFALVSGCALDWEVRADPGDASPGPDSFVPTDADAATDAPAAPECTALGAAVETARLKAKDCTLGMLPTQCSRTVRGACGCEVVVNADRTDLANDYEAAVSAFEASCTPDCAAACKPVGSPAAWSCLTVGSSRAQCTP